MKTKNSKKVRKKIANKIIKPVKIAKPYKVHVIGQNRTFVDQKEARDWACELLNAGIFFMELSEIKE